MTGVQTCALPIMDANSRLGDMALKLELAPDQATGFKAGEAGALLIPDMEATRRLRGLEKESPNWLQPGNSTALDHVNREHVLAFSKFCSEYKMSHIHEIWSKLSPAFSYRHAVIGVSANSDDETAKEALQAGVDAFLPKPFSMELFNMTAIKILTKIYDSYHEGVNE